MADTLKQILDLLQEVKEDMGDGFDRLGLRFDSLEAKIAAHDVRFEQVNECLNKIERKLKN